MEEIKVDFKKEAGKIKPEHAVNGGPRRSFASSGDIGEIFNELSIPYARYHDIASPYGSGQFIDIHCIFPDFDADENDSSSYNFECTDEYIAATINVGTKPFYRLGESIDHSGKHFFINPPSDYDKWARICEHIIRHYNEGWANGFHYDIKYWEIWNEPEGVPADEYYPMWTGTKEDFFRLYKVTANHLKMCFGEKIKIGGYSAISLAGCCERTKDLYDVFPNGKASMKKYYYEYFLQFLDYITSVENHAPIDFFSFHKYFNGIASIIDYVAMVKDIKANLINYGLGEIELICTEWNVLPKDKCAGMFAAANISAIMIASQKSCVDMAMYYMLMDSSYYNGVVQDGVRCKPYYALKSFANLYELGTEVVVEGENEIIYSLAAKNAEKEALIITNLGVDKDIKLKYTNDGIFYKCNGYITDEESNMKPIFSLGYPNPNGEVFLASTKNSIIYIEFTK